jgi:hypothetical protein
VSEDDAMIAVTVAELAEYATLRARELFTQGKHEEAQVWEARAARMLSASSEDRPHA